MTYAKMRQNYCKKIYQIIMSNSSKMDLTERKIFFHSAVLQDRPYGNYNASPTERTMLNL